MSVNLPPRRPRRPAFPCSLKEEIGLVFLGPAEPMVRLVRARPFRVVSALSMTLRVLNGRLRPDTSALAGHPERHPVAVE